jgi:6-phosphogluconolactonase
MTEHSADGASFYIGTYTEEAATTGEPSQGIYRATVSADGELELEGMVAESENPTFLTLNRDGTRLYALGKKTQTAGREGGRVSAFTVERNELRLLSEQSSGGSGPAHLSLDHNGRVLMVANYGSGSVASLPVGVDGRLEPPSQIIQHQGRGPITDRQDAPHAHCIIPDPQNRFALAADLGTDEVRVYPLEADRGKLAPEPVFVLKTPPGTGPRHLAFGPAGRTLYVSAELSSELLVYEYDSAKGTLHILQQMSTLPKGYEGENTVSEVALHPSGRFVFVANRGHDSIAVFLTDPARTVVPGGYFSTGGHFPRHFALDPTGEWLIVANQKSDNVPVFKVDQEYGELEPTGKEIRVAAPACIRFT